MRAARAKALERVLSALLDPFGHDDVDAWRECVRLEMGAMLGADQTTFQLPLPERVLFLGDFDVRLRRRYEEVHIPDLSRRKRYNARILAMGVGNRATFWGRDRPWLYRSSYYHEVVRPARAFDPIWAAAPVPGAALPAVLLAHHERRRGRHFTRDDLASMRLVRPALRAAVASLEQLLPHRVTLGATVDRLPMPVLLVDAGGRMVHQNPAATRLLGDEPAATALRAAAGDVAAAALAPFAPAADAPAERTVETPRGSYHVSATRAGAAVEGELALVSVRAPRGGPDAAEVRERFGLTARQTEVALLLARRRTDREIADALHVSPNTVRRHVDAVLRSLGIASRRDVRGRLDASAPSS